MMGRVPAFDECTARLRQRRGQRPQRRVLIAAAMLGSPHRDSERQEFRHSGF